MDRTTCAFAPLVVGGGFTIGGVGRFTIGGDGGGRIDGVGGFTIGSDGGGKTDGVSGFTIGGLGYSGEFGGNVGGDLTSGSG
ncbi:hypothetical protein PVK06_044539 [Gossypium arboreum]|uniref:Uncharacterized protein n=1 Tax=Gossypium arboreum TaxID=29729 RepID=A0ABR0MRF9_GOSAR|nr:hypothetical protein PVK06_044539 [Gossypium arboreum]